MIRPVLEDYLYLSKEHEYIPLYVKIMGDTLTPVQVYQLIRDISPYSYLLESVQQNEKLGRFSWIGLKPVMTFKSNKKDIEIQLENGQKERITGNPMKELFNVMEKFKPVLLDDLFPYQGGVVGYFGYDTIRHIEDIPDSNPDDLSIPESLFMLPKSVIVFDHLYQSVTIITQIKAGDKTEYEQGRNEIQELLDRIFSPKIGQTPLYISEEIEEE
ncbi:hypothetical protein KKA14_08410, partial [bacterium]|nr:hypothetical protein [bacterium]